MSVERVSGGIAIPFAEGHDYTRAEISKSVGGPIQPGISTPKRSPLVLIFTGGRGKKFGYKDHWTPEGTFVYTGQGKRGDMEYRLGNRAIEESGRSGKDILLFETQQGRVQRYFGRLRLLRSWREVLPDELGRPRQAILFELLPVGSPPVSRPSAEGRATRLADLRRRAHREASSNPARRLRGTTEFERSRAIVEYARGRADGICEACGREAPFVDLSGEPFLVCHHTQQLSDEGPDEPGAVGAICPNCHNHIHYGRDGAAVNAKLQAFVRKKEEAATPVEEASTKVRQ